MLTTNELIKKYVEHWHRDYKFNDLSIDDYILYGAILKVKWSELRRDYTDLDIKYNTHRRSNEIELDLLDYITFVSQLNNK